MARACSDAARGRGAAGDAGVVLQPATYKLVEPSSPAYYFLCTCTTRVVSERIRDTALEADQRLLYLMIKTPFPPVQHDRDHWAEAENTPRAVESARPPAAKQRRAAPPRLPRGHFRQREVMPLLLYKYMKSTRQDLKVPPAYL